MKIVTYNINGIRASSKRGLVKWLQNFDADIYALQEIRADENVSMEILYGSLLENVNAFEPILNISKKAGYSGTAILTKIKPNRVVYGFDGDDFEGRLITAYFDNFILINGYIPNGGTRLEYKMEYYEKLSQYINELKKQNNVIFVSDSNIAHTEDDVSNPSQAISKTGFLPMEQEAFTRLLNFGFSDSYRVMHPSGKAYSWRSYSERLYNNNAMKYRFDYIIINNELNNKLKSCEILDLEYSDHLPVVAEFDL